MTAFFDPLHPAGKPGYRSKRHVGGFAIRDTKVRRLNGRWGEVHVPKCGWVRFRWTRQLPAGLGMTRVTVDRAGRWHVSFPAPQPAVAGTGQGGRTGIDRGCGRRWSPPAAGTIARRGSPIARLPATSACSASSPASTRAPSSASVLAATWRSSPPGWPAQGLGREDQHPPGRQQRPRRLGEAEHQGHGAPPEA